MALSKIQSESINLADTFAFSGTVSGTGGITMADQWLLTTAVTYSSSQNTTITSNLARSTGDFNYIGTGMSESSGVFTFPLTGIYQIICQAQITSAPAQADYVGVVTQVDSGDGTFSTRAENFTSVINTADAHKTAYSNVFIDVTDASAFKVRFRTQSGNSFVLSGSGSNMKTGFTFIRLGDT
jgi:hypothetical protein